MSAGRMFRGALTAELLKLRKRPAVWILGIVLVVVIVFFGYLLLWALVRFSDAIPGMDELAGAGGLLDSLLPPQLVANLLTQLAGLGGPLVLVLAALAVGGEYSWGTWKTLATQRPGRTTLLGAQLAALGILLAVLVVAVLLSSWAASLLIAAVEGTGLAGPPAAEIARGVAASWLVLVVYAALGAALAVLFRGFGIALGIGLVYVLVLEGVLLAIPLPRQIGEVLQQVMISANTIALSQAFGEAPPADFGMPAIVIGPTQATIVLAAYAVILAGASLLLFRRRPIG